MEVKITKFFKGCVTLKPGSHLRNEHKRKHKFKDVHMSNIRMCSASYITVETKWRWVEFWRQLVLASISRQFPFVR